MKKMLVKEKKVYAAFMDLEKPCDSRLGGHVGCIEGLWYGLKVKKWNESILQRCQWIC